MVGAGEATTGEMLVLVLTIPSMHQEEEALSVPHPEISLDILLEMVLSAERGWSKRVV